MKTLVKHSPTSVCQIVYKLYGEMVQVNDAKEEKI